MKSFKEIIAGEDLNLTYHADEAESLARELRGPATPNYVLEKVRKVSELNFLYCRSQAGREDLIAGKITEAEYDNKLSACLVDTMQPDTKHFLQKQGKLI